MIKLAEWVIKSRINAVISVAAFSVIPFLFVLAGASQAFVVLRKGIAEGIPVLAWGGLAALMLLYFQGDATAFLMLVQATLFSYVLRTTVSWGALLLTAALFAVLSVFILPLLMSDVLYFLVDMVQQVFAEQEMKDIGDEALFRELVVASSIVQMCVAIFAVFLARNWQSSLYNPGGLRKEFLQLKLSIPIALVFGGMILLGESLGDDFYFLAQIVVPIIIIAGLALIHGMCAKVKNGKVGLIAFYIIGLSILSFYIINILIILVIIDSFVDIRGRLPSAESGSNKS